MITKFPENFLWGGDISASQSEGAWKEGGKAPIEHDFYLGGSKSNLRYAYYKDKNGIEGTISQFGEHLPKDAKYILKENVLYPNHFASDFYNRYKEDIRLFGEMGFKALNLSISWARILPNGIKGGINQEGVNYYREVLLELKKYSIKPIVTLYKYDMPVQFVEQLGGWTNRDLIDEYVEFCRVCLTEFKDLVLYWVTFNEINVSKVTLQLNPKTTDEDYQRAYEGIHNQLVAAAKVVKMGHEINEENQIGCMVAGIFSYPFTCDPKDQIENQKAKQDNFYYFADTIMRGQYPDFATRTWLSDGVSLRISEEDKSSLLSGKADFLAYSYYCSSLVTTHKNNEEKAKGNLTEGLKNPYLTESEWGWTIDSEGIKFSLHELNDRYNKPLLILENGLGALDVLEEDKTIHDEYRIDYLRKHLIKIKEAIIEGVNLIGYTVWSSIDLLSFSTGEMRKRYGLIYVDVDDDGLGTFNRYKKDSFYYYKKVCETNGEVL